MAKLKNKTLLLPKINISVPEIQLPVLSNDEIMTKAKTILDQRTRESMEDLLNKTMKYQTKVTTNTSLEDMANRLGIDSKLLLLWNKGAENGFKKGDIINLHLTNDQGRALMRSVDDLKTENERRASLQQLWKKQIAEDYGTDVKNLDDSEFNKYVYDRLGLEKRLKDSAHQARVDATNEAFNILNDPNASEEDKQKANDYINNEEQINVNIALSNSKAGKEYRSLNGISDATLYGILAKQNVETDKINEENKQERKRLEARAANRVANARDAFAGTVIEGLKSTPTAGRDAAGLIARTLTGHYQDGDILNAIGAGVYTVNGTLTGTEPSGITHHEGPNGYRVADELGIENKHFANLTNTITDPMTWAASEISPLKNIYTSYMTSLGVHGALDKTTNLNEDTKSLISNGVGFGVGFGSGNLATKAINGVKDFTLFDKVYIPLGDKTIDVITPESLQNSEYYDTVKLYITPFLAGGFAGVGKATENTLSQEGLTLGNNLFLKAGYNPKFLESVKKLIGKPNTSYSAIDRLASIKFNKTASKFDNGSRRLLHRFLPNLGEERTSQSLRDYGILGFGLNPQTIVKRGLTLAGSAAENYGKGLVDMSPTAAVQDIYNGFNQTDLGKQTVGQLDQDLQEGLSTGIMVYGNRLPKLTSKFDGKARSFSNQATEGLAGGVAPLHRAAKGTVKLFFPNLFPNYKGNYNGNIMLVEMASAQTQGLRAGDASGYGEGNLNKYNKKEIDRDSTGYYDHGHFREGWIYPESSSHYNTSKVHNTIFRGSRYERRLPGLEWMEASDMPYQEYQNFMKLQASLDPSKFFHLANGDVGLGHVWGFNADGTPLILNNNTRGHWAESETNGYHDLDGSGSGANSLGYNSARKEFIDSYTKEHGTAPSNLDMLKFNGTYFGKASLMPAAKGSARWLDLGAEKLGAFSTRAHLTEGGSKHNRNINTGDNVRSETFENNIFDVMPSEMWESNARAFYDAYDKINLSEHSQMLKLYDELQQLIDDIKSNPKYKSSSKEGKQLKQRVKDLKELLKSVIGHKTKHGNWSIDKFINNSRLIRNKARMDAMTGSTDNNRNYTKTPMISGFVFSKGGNLKKLIPRNK